MADIQKIEEIREKTEAKRKKEKEKEDVIKEQRNARAVNLPEGAKDVRIVGNIVSYTTKDDKYEEKTIDELFTKKETNV